MAILLHKSLPLMVVDSKSDTGGRFVVVWGLIEGRAYNLISVYAPTQLQKKTLMDLSKILINLPQGTTIIGGTLMTS